MQKREAIKYAPWVRTGMLPEATAAAYAIEESKQVIDKVRLGLRSGLGLGLGFRVKAARITSRLSTADECEPGNAPEVVVLRGIGGSLEHVEHTLGDEEASEDVNRRNKHCQGGKGLSCRRG